MKLFPAYFGARQRDSDVAPPEPEADSRDRVFRLIPPRAETIEPAERYDPAEPAPIEPPPEIGRNVHPVDAMDLTRLSIDNDGRLYWDGKPVEVRRRLMMSRAQIVGISLIGLFAVIGAVGAAIQGSATAYEWACRMGWTDLYCSPAPAPTPARPDIPT